MRPWPGKNSKTPTYSTANSMPPAEVPVWPVSTRLTFTSCPSIMTGACNNERVRSWNSSSVHCKTRQEATRTSSALNTLSARNSATACMRCGFKQIAWPPSSSTNKQPPLPPSTCIVFWHFAHGTFVIGAMARDCQCARQRWRFSSSALDFSRLSASRFSLSSSLIAFVAFGVNSAMWTTSATQARALASCFPSPVLAATQALASSIHRSPSIE
mmetsp:Transcript_41234/g.113729  ORF Transcript_41234/g.113729 Transcript_41234/m.113729 type:complete len:214 (+) Transcript_41234:757-1398(+)